MAQSVVAREGVEMSVVGSAVRGFTLVGATLTAGLISGFFYAYACSVTVGLEFLSDERYIATMQAINATVRNGTFAFSFFGATLFLLAAVAAHLPRTRSRRFAFIVAAALFYIVGGFVLTFTINVPMNETLATVDLDSSAQVLAQARADYEGPWNFWNWVRTIFSGLALLAMIAACMSSPAARN